MAHENQLFITQDNQIYCTSTGEYIRNMAFIIDTETGTVLANGEADTIKARWAVTCGAMKQIINPDVFKLIELDNANLTPDEICTYVNYIRNSLPADKANEMLGLLGTPELKNKLAHLTELGF